MKLYCEPIEVAQRGRWPDRVLWRRHTYQVREVEDFWIYEDKWWDHEERRVYFRVRTDRGILEIYRRDDVWTLSRMHD